MSTFVGQVMLAANIPTLMAIADSVDAEILVDSIILVNQDTSSCVLQIAHVIGGGSPGAKDWFALEVWPGKSTYSASIQNSPLKLQVGNAIYVMSSNNLTSAAITTFK